MTPRFWLRYGFTLLFGAVLGCSLSDYEAKMKASQDKVHRFDDEVKLLDEPAQIPIVKVKDKENNVTEQPMVELFMPLPRGLTGKYEPARGLLWKYPRKPKPGPTPGQPPAQPQPAAPAPPPAQGQPGAPNAGPGTEFLEVDLAWSTDPDKKKFIDNVLRQLPAKGQRTAKEPPLEVDTYPRGKRPFPKVKYEATYEFYDPQDNFCSANFRTMEKDKETGKDYLHVAVVFKIEKKKPQTGVQPTPVNAEEARAMLYCLEWLALDYEKAQVLTEYTYRIPKTAPKPAAPPTAAPGGPAGAAK